MRTTEHRRMQADMTCLLVLKLLLSQIAPLPRSLFALQRYLNLGEGFLLARIWWFRCMRWACGSLGWSRARCRAPRRSPSSQRSPSRQTLEKCFCPAPKTSGPGRSFFCAAGSGSADGALQSAAQQLLRPRGGDEEDLVAAFDDVVVAGWERGLVAHHRHERAFGGPGDAPNGAADQP